MVIKYFFFSFLFLNAISSFADCSYALPYPPGTRYHTLQGISGKFSHITPLQYAVDFSMPIGSPVHASRAGRVHEIKQDSQLSGKTLDFLDHANFVKIKHQDGTFALYAHLQYQQVKVEVGQQVLRGQLLGHSGCTGFCDGPHLHFEIYRQSPEGLRGRISLPIQLKTKEGIFTGIKRQTSYTSIVLDDDEACL